MLWTTSDATAAVVQLPPASEACPTAEGAAAEAPGGSSIGPSQSCSQRAVLIVGPPVRSGSGEPATSGWPPDVSSIVAGIPRGVSQSISGSVTQSTDGAAANGVILADARTVALLTALCSLEVREA